MKILLPTDGSRYALAAARALSGWFAWSGGEVDVLAITPEEPKSDHRHFGKDTETDRDWHATVGRWLQETTAHLEGSGLRSRQLTRSGDPASVMLDVAWDGYDLIAVGMKGRAEEPFLEEDSVARAILEHAPTSVLLVREREPHGRQHRLPTPQRPLRVLLAVDGGGPAKGAAEAYSRLVPADRADVTALAVADAAEGGFLGEPDAWSVVRRVASELEDHGIAAEPRIATGQPAAAILEAADEADLVVMGSTASGDLGVVRLGSVGQEVALSSPCSLLIMREAAPEGTVEEGEEPEAATPFEVSYENLEPSPAAERHVLRGVSQLERVAPDLMAVRVTLATRNPRHTSGNLYDVNLELTLPGPDVVVSRTPARHQENEDLVTAIGEAFEKARRKLVELHAIQRGEVKSHAPKARGEVTDLFPDHGFIRGSDGRLVYFHRNSVAAGGWDDLEVGAEVRFVDEPGEEGPHATTVTVTRQGRTAPAILPNERTRRNEEPGNR